MTTAISRMKRIVSFHLNIAARAFWKTWRGHVLTAIDSKALMLLRGMLSVESLCHFFIPAKIAGMSIFDLTVGEIMPLTPVGRVTAELLKFNLPQRVEVRETLILAGRYPRRV
ncbi:MAG: hypothetical protein ETSY2_14455 [Candidatus Entotheonella gemina]|uniref:Uncharacterized protein n=1 Tax=Candidatus Entotheonella gemina TaxID=1429439 RepID=W4M9K1_9BACT|nr:MAG: hypothetical protein ETSY2_14455 [Candidatus Entotheonella gemina]